VPAAQKPSWSWGSAISAFIIFLLSMAGGVLGGLVGSKARGHHAVGVCAGRAMMANGGQAEAVPMRAVVDGGCTHASPFRMPSAEYGYHYLVGFTHEASGYTAVYPTRKHDAEELIRITKRYRGDMARYDLDLKILRTDNGPEMCSAAFQTYLAEALILWERSAPYVHEQIGLQERRWGIIIPKVIAMLKQGGAKLKHWASAARYAAYLVNMEPLERRDDKRSPHERLTGKPVVTELPSKPVS
jgi:hypothetical protein